MKSGLIILLSLSVATSATSPAGFFDLAEYRKISYDASIGEDLFWFAPEFNIETVSPENIDELEQRIVDKLPGEKESNYIFVTSKGGQKFACSLPEVESLKAENAPKTSRHPKVYGEMLAASFYVNKCIKMRGNHWWSYVLCRGLTVEQIHGEPDRDGYVKNILGMFDGNITMPSYSESTEDRLLYVEESYSAGTFCDLEENKQPRTTSVRYECDPSLSTNEAYVHSVVEVKPCQYMMFVKVGTLCSFPEFLPASQANTQNIGCQPYMNRMEIRSLLVKQLEQQQRLLELEEEEREARLTFKLATERYTAMTKAHRLVDLKSLQKKINAEMDHRAANFDILALIYERAGKDQSELSAVWDTLNKVDLEEYILYVDYETIQDENRGHLWYYFHDPTWPKDHFPKDIYSIAIQNGYITEVSDLLKHRFLIEEIDTVFIEEFLNFAKTGVFDLDLNLVITAEEILEDIARNGSLTENSKWIRVLHNTFLRRGDVVYKRVSRDVKQPLYKQKTFGGIVESLLPYLFDEIEQTMKTLSEKGHVEEKDPIFNILKVTPRSKDSKLTYDAAFELSILEDKTELLSQLQKIYLKRIAPFYHMISIMYFQKTGPDYFHVWPPEKNHLDYNWETDDLRFHVDIAWDAASFSMMLSDATILKMSHEILNQKEKEKAVFDVPTFLEARKIYSKKWFDLDYYGQIALDEIFVRLGDEVVHEARERIWKKKVEGYRMAYWKSDYKKRKEAKSLHELMHSLLLSIDKTDTIQTVGGPMKKKVKSLSEKDFMDIMGKDGEPKKGALWKKFTDSILDSVADGGSLNEEEAWDQMNDVMDLLGKAGLDKDVDVQIKMFDADGVEIFADELDAVKKDLLAEVDSIKRFKDTEKAYSTKFTVEDSSEEDER